MRVLYNKKGAREGDRQSFAFFIVGAVVVLVAVFLLGIYFGRELEKGGGAADNHAYRAPGEPSRAEWAVQGAAVAGRASDKVRSEIGSFSEEAVRVPVVPPGRAEVPAAQAEADNALTFQETLAKKDAEPVPLEKPKAPAPPSKAGKPASGAHEGGVLVQAGAFKDKEKAEARRKKMEKAGYSVRLSKGGKGGLFLVVAGPYPDRDAARGAVAKLKSEHKIDAIVSND